MQKPSLQRIAVVGCGRLGTAMQNALEQAGLSCCPGPFGRGADGDGADLVLLCVPDRSISEASMAIKPGPLVVHTSGASSLSLLSSHTRQGVIHPLLSVPDGSTPLRGAFAATRASTPSDLTILLTLVDNLGMTPLQVTETDRAAYHAAASLASNALVALQLAAADIAATADVPATALRRLAQASLDQVGSLGAAALTGPAVRGDWETVASQREAILSRTPHLTGLFDAATTECARLAGYNWSANQRHLLPGNPPRITIARNRDELVSAVQTARSVGARVGLVPTMGGLHQGHARLIEVAASQCNCVVTSIFVNPRQFNNETDLASYPRNEAGDLEVAAEAGTTIAFIPTVDVMYPESFSTTIQPGPLGEVLEGRFRPGHFEGMATVVTRLLGLVQADIAFFGRKDAQQLAIISQLVRDLSIATEVQGVDTVRDSDGLAMSSRNTRLSSEQRDKALALSRGLFAARALALNGERSANVLEQAVLNELSAESLDVEYVSLVSEDTFRKVSTLDQHCVLVAAAHVGDVRLIDNISLQGEP